MKTSNLKLLSLASLFVLVGVISCKKDNDGGPSTGFTATLNGKAFQPTIVGGIMVGGEISIIGAQVKSGDTITLQLSIPETVTVNSGISIRQADASYGNSNASFDFWSGYGPSHGTVTVTSWDKNNKKIAGTISGVIYQSDALDSVVITNGQFNTTYLP